MDEPNISDPAGIKSACRINNPDRSGVGPDASGPQSGHGAKRDVARERKKARDAGPRYVAGLSARYLVAFGTAAALASCSTVPGSAAPNAPQDAFWAALSSHCGQAYGGSLVSDDAADADMQGAAMVMQVRGCTATEIRVPFHVKQTGGEWDRSRTWVFTRTGPATNSGDPGGLRLKHDHRHDDGTSDAVTMYGGDTADVGTTSAQNFPVDSESVALFRREGLDVSVTNVWRVEVDPAGTPDANFTYQLQRTVAGGAPAPRLFRVEFDLTQPVPAPPAPWGG